MAVAFVREVGTFTTKSGTLVSTINVTNTHAAGNTIVLIWSGDNLSITSMTVTDTKGNTWVTRREIIRMANGTGNSSIYVASCKLTTSLVSGDSINIDHVNVASRAMGAWEFSGVSDVLDADASTGADSDWIAGSLTVPSTDTLLVALAGINGPSTSTYTPSASWSSPPSTVFGTSGGAAGSNITSICQYRLAPAAGVQQNWSVGVSAARPWQSYLIALRAEGGTPPPAGGTIKVMQGGVWVDKPYMVKVGGTFVQKPITKR